MIVHPGIRRTKEAIEGMEEYTEPIYGQSENGWMDSQLFLIYLHHVANFVNVNQIPKPIIFFVDGHSTHMSHSSAVFCSENGIILYCLLAIATHI